MVPSISTTECTQHVVAPPLQLHKWWGRGFSQLGADGVIHKLFADIGVTDKYYVEFGTQNASECNTRRLRETCGWSGLLMDGGHDNPAINLHRAFITRENIVSLLRKYNVPKSFDLLSVDIDGNDYHVLKSILRHYQPRVIIVETNFEISKSLTIPYTPNHRWDGSCRGSASVEAFRRLHAAFGYSQVSALPPDTYWVRNDVRRPNYTVPDMRQFVNRKCDETKFVDVSDFVF